MNPKTTELIARIKCLDAEIDRVSALIPAGASQRRMVRRLKASSTGVDTSYRAAANSYGDQFIDHIAAGARHARRLTRLLQDVIQLQWVPIEAIREVILEARGVEAILVASRNTAKRRRKARLRTTPTQAEETSRRAREMAQQIWLMMRKKEADRRAE